MRIAIIGGIAAMSTTAVAGAVPSEPNDYAECHPYGTAIDDCGYFPDPPDGGDPPDSGGASSSSDCTWSEDYGFDIIKLTGNGIDFGDRTFVAGAPLGPGSVHWSVPNCDYYTASVVGTLHLDGVSGQYGRMHVSYWWGGELVDTRHGGTVRAPDNGHENWSVNISPFIGMNVDEVHVCTELSTDGVNFTQVACKTRSL